MAASALNFRGIPDPMLRDQSRINWYKGAAKIEVASPDPVNLRDSLNQESFDSQRNALIQAKTVTNQRIPNSIKTLPIGPLRVPSTKTERVTAVSQHAKQVGTVARVNPQTDLSEGQFSFVRKSLCACFMPHFTRKMGMEQAAKGNGKCTT